MSRSRRKNARVKVGPERPAVPSDGPYQIIWSKDFPHHLMGADHTRIALLDDAHADSAEVAANAELLRASWELREVVAAFVADIEAVRGNAPEYLREEWPDLNDSYNRAVVLLHDMRARTQESLPHYAANY